MIALQDLRDGMAMHELWIFLGWRDVRKHYRRSVIGPFWLTLSMGIMVGSLGVLYSQIFGMDIYEYLPFLAVGFIIWNFISSTVVAACSVFSGASGSIRQIRLPLSVYIFQFIWAQFINLCHNMLIYLIVLALFSIPIGWSVFLFIPAVFIYILNGTFAVMVLGPLCARFRDIPMIVSSLVQVVFFMTPILWSAEQLPQRIAFVAMNPFYHFVEIGRDPLLGGTGTLANWIACIAMTTVFGAVATSFFARYRNRIPYWA